MGSSARGDEVRVLDNFSTGNRANLDGLDVEIVEGELRSYERVHNAVRGVDLVYHLGALGSVPRSVQDPLTSSAVNVEGTLNVLLAARDEGIRRVVFSSSASVYGSSRQMPTTEESPPDPVSPYGVAKLAAERYCVSFSRVYESFESVVLRYFNVFGPRQSPFSQYAAAVPLFITKIAAGEQIDVYGDGEQSRDFTYVANVVDATFGPATPKARTARSSTSPRARPQASTPLPRRSVRSSASRCERRELPRRPGDLRDSWADLSKSQRVLGYEPSVDLETGFRRTVEASWLERIKVLRVIARLNVGGPALHVAYLTEGLASRGYDTTLVAGTLAPARSPWPTSPRAAASRRGARCAASRDLPAQRPAGGLRARCTDSP